MNNIDVLDLGTVVWFRVGNGTTRIGVVESVHVNGEKIRYTVYADGMTFEIDSSAVVAVID